MRKILFLFIIFTIPLFAQRWTSTVNSSSTYLSGNATFAGGKEKANDNSGNYAYNWINVTVKSVQSGAGKVYQSKDGTTWDHVDVFTHTGGDTLSNTLSVPIILDYFKVTYTNGVSAQTTFRLTTVLTNGILPLDASGNLKTSAVLAVDAGALATSANQIPPAILNLSSDTVTIAAGAIDSSKTFATATQYMSGNVFSVDGYIKVASDFHITVILGLAFPYSHTTDFVYAPSVFPKHKIYVKNTGTTTAHILYNLKGL